MKENIRLSIIIFFVMISLVAMLSPVIPTSYALEGEVVTSSDIEIPVNVDMSKSYKVYLSTTKGTISLGSFNDYNSALNKTKEIDANLTNNPIIMYNNKLIYATYGVVRMNEFNGTARPGDGEVLAIQKVPRGKVLAYVASGWGIEAAFLGYSDGYYKVKISGLIGWVDASKVTLHSVIESSNPTLTVTGTISINVRSSASTSGAIIGAVYNGSRYTYYPDKTVTGGGYTWYYIQYSDTTCGYVASQGDDWVVTNNGAYSMLNIHSYYFVSNNILYHQFIQKGATIQSALGTAPFYYSSKQNRTYYLKNGSYKYYSFDSNYFYDDYKLLIDDYRNENYENAINYKDPYFAYFMYLPSHSKSGVTAGMINSYIANAGIRSGLLHSPSYYFNPNTGAKINPVSGSESVLYNMGSTIVSIANKYAINPNTIYSTAMVESGQGRSAIAIIKNNLFGYGAVDADPFGKAVTYSSVAESIEDYAKRIGGGGNSQQAAYSRLDGVYYNGTHNGNKLSGFKTWYATDPFAGESATRETFLADRGNGSPEEFSNTIGVTIANQGTPAVKIYKQPSNKSAEVYTIKNYLDNEPIYHMPLIVIDKVYVVEDGHTQGYYKVQTDVQLDANQNVNYNVLYDFDLSYGYIKEEDLYVQNTQPVITTEDITVDQFGTVDYLKYVSATDYEDGDLNETNIVVDSSQVNLNKFGTYKVKYIVTDSSNYNATKEATVTVNPAKEPVIQFTEDLELGLNQTHYDLKKGVNVIDAHDGDITSLLEVESTTLDITRKGEYTVTYIAKNSGDITGTKTRTVRVVDNESPVLTVENVTIFLDDSFNPLDIATAYDKEDGNVTDRITYTGNIDTLNVGTFPIAYLVTDLNNNYASKTITVTIEDKIYEEHDSVFYLDTLMYNEETNMLDFKGFLIIKGMNNILDTMISYSIIFENQYDGSVIIKNLSRLTKDYPFDAPSIDNYTNLGSWFSEAIDLTNIPSGNYSVYVRARSGDYESKIYLKNAMLKNISSKFTIGEKGYQLRTNYYSKQIPLELIVREEGLVSSTNNPSIDNMFNQLYSVEFTEDNKLHIIASSHNVYGDYSLDSNVTRHLLLEDIATSEKVLDLDIGSITTGPYKISLRVADGFDKTRAWYDTSIDVSGLERGKYTIIVRTATGDIDDYGELYDLISPDQSISKEINDKKYTIIKNKDRRYRLELIVE